MTCYADSGFYLNTYKPPCPMSASDFNFWANQASAIIRSRTFDNIDESREIPEEVSMCCCEIAGLFFDDDKRKKETGGLSSESVGGWSKSYESAESAEKALNRQIAKAIRKWLSGTGLLYSGVRV